MTDEIRPRRSALYMPGANDKALEKAKSLPTDAIIFDTEEHARAAVPAVQPPPGGPTVVSCEVFEVAREA